MKLLAVFLLVFSMKVVMIANQEVSCPFGWTLINSRCFQYVADEMTWARAERNCLSMGANLASIPNMNEYRQIQTLIFTASHESNVAWVGGSNAQEENIWLWSDGNRFSYTNWCPGEPNNDEGMQRCLHINNSDAKCWDDYWCGGRKPSVCAKKA
ncbi:ladderlectin-like [Gambusia affinis]|uniref:ladderlectin-like n=1 Tax=Gambusia affinis TaxID=33528 RepID=UPI001CDBA0C7|nr:ladderlectin-like [Gambusia affinis]